MMPTFWQLATTPILKIQQFPLSCWFLGKIFLILCPLPENSTTRITIDEDLQLDGNKKGTKKINLPYGGKSVLSGSSTNSPRGGRRGSPRGGGRGQGRPRGSRGRRGTPRGSLKQQNESKENTGENEFMKQLAQQIKDSNGDYSYLEGSPLLSPKVLIGNCIDDLNDMAETQAEIKVKNIR